MPLMPAYDHIALHTLCASARNDADICMQLLEVFQRTGPVMVGRLAAAMALGDSAQLHNASHALKGSALQIGAHQLGDLASSIAQASARCDLGGAALATSALQQEFTRVMVEVADCFHRGTAMLGTTPSAA